MKGVSASYIFARVFVYAYIIDLYPPATRFSSSLAPRGLEERWMFPSRFCPRIFARYLRHIIELCWSLLYIIGSDFFLLYFLLLLSLGPASR